MKTVFFASATVAALIAAPAMAQETSGSVSVSYAHSDVEYGSDAGMNVGGVAVDGTVATPIFGDWTVTFDGEASYEDGKWVGSDVYLNGGVAMTKTIGQYRVGGFYAAEQALNSTIHTFGAIGQKYYEKATVTGAASYSTIFDFDVWALNTDVAYYVTDSVRLNAGLGYQNIDTHYVSSDSYTANIGAEYQVAASPYSVFAEASYTDNDNFDITDTQVKVGVRYNFGGGLQARDRAGANLNLKSFYNPTSYFN